MSCSDFTTRGQGVVPSHPKRLGNQWLESKLPIQTTDKKSEGQQNQKKKKMDRKIGKYISKDFL